MGIIKIIMLAIISPLKRLRIKNPHYKIFDSKELDKLFVEFVQAHNEPD